MKDALPRSCLKVVVLYSLLLCVLPPLLNTPAWPQAVAETQNAKSSVKFAPPVLRTPLCSRTTTATEKKRSLPGGKPTTPLAALVVGVIISRRLPNLSRRLRQHHSPSPIPMSPATIPGMEASREA